MRIGTPRVPAAVVSRAQAAHAAHVGAIRSTVETTLAYADALEELRQAIPRHQGRIIEGEDFPDLLARYGLCSERHARRIMSWATAWSALTPDQRKSLDLEASLPSFRTSVSGSSEHLSAKSDRLPGVPESATTRLAGTRLATPAALTRLAKEPDPESVIRAAEAMVEAGHDPSYEAARAVAQIPDPAIRSRVIATPLAVRVRDVQEIAKAEDAPAVLRIVETGEARTLTGARDVRQLEQWDRWATAPRWIHPYLTGIGDRIRSIEGALTQLEREMTLAEEWTERPQVAAIGTGKITSSKHPDAPTVGLASIIAEGRRQAESWKKRLKQLQPHALCEDCAGEGLTTAGACRGCKGRGYWTFPEWEARR